MTDINAGGGGLDAIPNVWLVFEFATDLDLICYILYACPRLSPALLLRHLFFVLLEGS